MADSEQMKKQWRIVWNLLYEAMSFWIYCCSPQRLEKNRGIPGSAMGDFKIVSKQIILFLFNQINSELSHVLETT